MDKYKEIMENIKIFKGCGERSPCLSNFIPGTLTQSIVSQLANETRGAYETDLRWLASCAVFFQFISYDGFYLQAYFIPSMVSTSTKPSIVFCAGWTETSLKYTKLFRFLAEAGHNIYSFDIRGQGYSCPMHFNKGPVSHLDDFQDYVKDLKYFINTVVKGSKRYTKEAPNHVVYLATSMATIIGLQAVQQEENLFTRMVLVAPALRTQLNIFLLFILWLLRLIGLGSLLLVRFNEDIAKIPCTHKWENRAAYLRLRHLSPTTQIQGPTISWLLELIKAGNQIMTNAKDLKVKTLLIQGDMDNYVDNHAMLLFFSTVGADCRMLKLKNCYHEILQETDEIFKQVISEIQNFMEF